MTQLADLMGQAWEAGLGLRVDDDCPAWLAKAAQVGPYNGLSRQIERSGPTVETGGTSEADLVLMGMNALAGARLPTGTWALVALTPGLTEMAPSVLSSQLAAAGLQAAEVITVVSSRPTESTGPDQIDATEQPDSHDGRLDGESDKCVLAVAVDQPMAGQSLAIGAKVPQPLSASAGIEQANKALLEHNSHLIRLNQEAMERQRLAQQLAEVVIERDKLANTAARVPGLLEEQSRVRAQKDLIAGSRAYRIGRQITANPLVKAVKRAGRNPKAADGD
ncbi:MAG: hypothetical protein FWG16_00020 [Micrococcales bacterium]|nr:hypothetical protein [Micrococcales bacterium]